MNKNYRLRTQVGVDREIQVQLDQDWNTIEILSLKILQSDIYTRMCSDYGVVAGRVVANGGYGVPNVRVSVFVPITAEDELDPTISTLYPYKQFGDKNEDGYRYNLLPYQPSHGGHTPTGTFPSLEDVLTNQTVLEVYEKYYKFTVKTNESGDYMIFGCPLGNQTVVMDMDLSDIGPFSLSPQDLIRMGKATEDQISGTRFKTSTNLDELPQIVTASENIDVSPFWGDEGLCQVRIERVDFDLRNLGVEITPTATFMGSLISGVDDLPLKQSCRPSLDGGDLCSLTTGPGQIIAIRQSPILDENNRPFLEQYRLDNDGKVIDENGVWLIEVPMNLEYLITNEFGEQIVSQDPSVGIPTSGKYRFKVKWEQSNELGGPVRRAYYIVPNVREYGWNNSNTDPLVDLNPSDTNYKSAKASYYFGVDWSGYTTSTNPLDQRIVDAINCDDTFYKFEYNKVYTVAQHIDQFNRGIIRSRFIGIKDITNTDCETENNKFPITDGVMSSDLLYFLVSVLLSILYFPMLAIMFATHILALIFPILKYLIAFVFFPLILTVSIICNFLGVFGFDFDCPSPIDTFNSITSIPNPFRSIPLPMLSYPECDACDCKSRELGEGDLGKEAQKEFEQNSPSCSASFFNYQNYVVENDDWKKSLAGIGSPNTDQRILRLRTPMYGNVGTTPQFPNNALPIWERANLFNLKSKYFNNDPTQGSNRIKVIVEPSLNGNNPNLYHYDNVIVYLVNNDCLSNFSSGKLLTFSTNDLTKDPNPIEPQTGTTETGITGTTSSSGSLTINWANPSSPSNNNTTTYSVTSFNKNEKYKFPTDLEYFQVITGMTVAQFTATSTSSSILTYSERVLLNTQGQYNYQDNYEGFDKLGVVVMVRGVDPNSGRHEISYNLSQLFGYTAYISNFDIKGSFYLNVPVQSGEANVRHNTISVSNQTTPQGKLYYPSFYFTPGTQFSSYTTNAHAYYSSLDCTQVNNYSIDPNNVNQTKLLQTYVSNCTPTSLTLKSVPSGSGNSLVGGLPSSNGGGLYFEDEYIEGGSYITTYPIYSTTKLVNDYKYFAPMYNTGITTTIVASNIVMRSDRLPTGNIINPSGNNVFALQASNTLSITFYDENGVGQFNQQNVDSITLIKFGDTDDFGTGESYNKVIESFTCDGMVDLDCYKGSGTNFTSLGPDDDCNKNGFGRYKVVEGGCYSLVNVPIVTMPGDLLSITEWFNRFRLTYALCRGVIGHSFTNSWINGTLYAYPFALETTFDRNNKPVSDYCEQTIYLDNDTSNFYYRSSPYNQNSGEFIGKETNYTVKVNKKLIQTPTTILDLGPKYFWSREVSLNPNYFGYIMDKIPTTSYQNISDLSQLFAVSRLTNTSFLGLLLNSFTDRAVADLFTRRNEPTLLRVDGDYIQMVQINSQFGVNEFNNENYQETSSTSTSAIFVNTDDNNNSVMGVFFSSNTQNRDYISPRRIIRNEDTLIINADYLPINTQKVPYYLWGIKRESQYIFGSEKNDWDTEIIKENGYQDFDRNVYPYYQGDSSVVKFNPGYIFSVGNSTPITYNYQPNVGPNHKDKTMVSAPWYFYFGLKKGRTAMDKFYSTYIDTI
jgi:hypothetical protein